MKKRNNIHKRRKKIPVKFKLKYDDLVKNVNDVLFVVDKDGKITYINAVINNIAGYKPSEFIGKPFKEFFYKDDLPAVLKNLKDLMNNRLHPNEYRIIAKSKELRWVRISSKPIYKRNKYIGLHGILVDVTEQKQNEEKLIENEKFLDSIVENLPNMIFVKDAKELRFVRFNKAGEELLGYSMKDMLGKNDYDFFPKDEADFFVNKDKEVLKNKTLLDIPEEKIQTKYKGERILHTKKVPILDKKGDPQYLLGISEDITEHKKIQRLLLESEMQYKQLVEKTDMGFVAIDTKGIVIDANEPYIRLVGAKKKQEVFGHSVLEWTAPQEKENNARAIALCAKQGYIQDFETVYLQKDGTRINISIDSTVHHTPDGNRLMSICRNVTERKRAEEENKKLQEQLNQSQKMEAIGRLVGGVAHDFNNQLTAILGFCNVAMRNPDASDKLKDDLQQIKKYAEASASLTRQLLAFARKQVLNPIVINMNDLLSDMERMLSKITGEKIQIIYILSNDLWMVKVDYVQIQQVVLNLVLNAHDAMPAGGKLTIETKNIDINDSSTDLNPDAKAGQHVVLEVNDTGHGMSEETLAHIFEPFFTTKEIGKGTGLGLSTVHGIIKQSGGHISVQSSPKGTSFKIYFPRALEDVKGVQQEEVPESLNGSETILLVEDEPGVKMILKRILNSAGYKVVEASDTEEAIDVHKRFNDKIHLLITDMAKMSIKELSDKIIRLDPGINILYMTDYSYNDITDQMLSAEKTGFIQKPIIADDLLCKVRKLLDKAK